MEYGELIEKENENYLKKYANYKPKELTKEQYNKIYKVKRNLIAKPSISELSKMDEAKAEKYQKIKELEEEYRLEVERMKKMKNAVLLIKLQQKIIQKDYKSHLKEKEKYKEFKTDYINTYKNKTEKISNHQNTIDYMKKTNDMIDRTNVISVLRDQIDNKDTLSQFEYMGRENPVKGKLLLE